MKMDMLIRIERIALGFAALIALVAGVLWGSAGLLAATVGGALSMANLRTTRMLATRAFRGVSEGSMRTPVLLLAAFTAKLGVLALAIFVCVRVFGLAVVPLMLGLSVLVIGIVLAGITWQVKEGI